MGKPLMLSLMVRTLSMSPLPVALIRRSPLLKTSSQQTALIESLRTLRPTIFKRLTGMTFLEHPQEQMSLTVVPGSTPLTIHRTRQRLELMSP